MPTIHRLVGTQLCWTVESEREPRPFYKQENVLPSSFPPLLWRRLVNLSTWFCYGSWVERTPGGKPLIFQCLTPPIHLHRSRELRVLKEEGFAIRKMKSARRGPRIPILWWKKAQFIPLVWLVISSTLIAGGIVVSLFWKEWMIHLGCLPFHEASLLLHPLLPLPQCFEILIKTCAQFTCFPINLSH